MVDVNIVNISRINYEYDDYNEVFSIEMEVENEWNEEMELMIDIIFKMLRSKVDWKYLVITFSENFVKQIKDEDHEKFSQIFLKLYP